MGDADLEYAKKLEEESAKWWKLLLDVQRPYRWNLKRLDLGRTLDVGCGVGRNLVNLAAGSIGVDLHEYVVSAARRQGCDAYTPEDFFSRHEAPFDSILLSHVLEHLTPEESRDMLDAYLPYLKGGGRVVVICPQEKGFGPQEMGFSTLPRGDSKGEAHVTFLDAPDIESLLTGAGLGIERAYSFPFPRPVGRVFRYNETIVIARKE